MDRRIAAALVSALAVGVTSCGSAQPKLTRAELVSKVVAACAAGAQTAQRDLRSAAGSSSESVRFGSAIIAGQRVIIGRLTGLNAPADVKHDFVAFRTGLQQRLRVYEQMLAAFRGGGQPSAAVQQRQQMLFQQLDTLAKRQGFGGCI